MDGTKGKTIVWQSEPILKNLHGRYFLSRENQRGMVAGHLGGVGGITIVLAFHRDSGLKYSPIDELVGFRIFDTRQARNRAQAATQECPAESYTIAGAA
jgi:hypothetical protein